MSRSECGHNYLWPYSSDKNLSGTHSGSYCSKALIANAELLAISQIKKLQQLTRDPRVETFGGPEARMCPRRFPQLLRQVLAETDLSRARQECPGENHHWSVQTEVDLDQGSRGTRV